MDKAVGSTQENVFSTQGHPTREKSMGLMEVSRSVEELPRALIRKRIALSKLSL
jgi:hypothetical protein